MRIGFWIKNARNIALPQSLLPCLTAIVLCIGEEGFVWWLAIPVILGVCAAHLGMNLADDYFDYKHDSRTRADISSTSIRARMEKCHYLEPSPALPKGGSEIAAKAAVDGRSATPVDGRTPQSHSDSSPINKGAEEVKGERLEVRGGEVFDLVFIDADKKEYCDYLDLVLPLMNEGGWILADNTLWDGHIIDPAYDKDKQTVALRAFNDKVAEDERLEKVILPLRDGLTVMRVESRDKR